MSATAPSSSPPRPSLYFTLRELLARHATGVVSVRTADASGEVRLRTGAIEDAVLGRVEGTKALARMLAARDLSLAFTEGDGEWLRRIDGAPEEILDAAAQACAALEAALEPFRDREREGAFAIASEPTETTRATLSAGARTLVTRLRAPAAIGDVLDLAADDDVVVLGALAELDRAGAIRWLNPASERQPITSALWDRAAISQRLPPRVRLVFAGAPQRLAVLAHVLAYVDDVTRPTIPPPLVPAPQVLATAAFDGLSLEIVGCPLVPAYAPLWPLALADAALVVRLDEAAPDVLEAAAAVAHARVVSAEALVGPVDEARVGAVVALLRAALDEAATENA